MHAKEPGSTQRTARHIGTQSEEPFEDTVVVEEPLEIRLSGDTVAITMRTPGNDRELTMGFLLAEGIIASRDDVGSLAPCGRPGGADYGNVIDVRPGPGVCLDIDRVIAARRGTLTTASCGVCGRQTITDLLSRCVPLDDPRQIATAQLFEWMGAMGARQVIFQRTGGLHAAALWSPGHYGPVFEDIGRHNAVDKAVGAQVLGTGIPSPLALTVSGRVSFEIVQKAAVARVPVVASVSAPSSLAIDLASHMNITLVSFVRDHSATVYCGAERLRSAARA